MRVPLPSPRTGGQGEDVESSQTKRANRGRFLFAGGEQETTSVRSLRLGGLDILALTACPGTGQGYAHG